MVPTLSIQGISTQGLLFPVYFPDPCEKKILPSLDGLCGCVTHISLPFSDIQLSEGILKEMLLSVYNAVTSKGVFHDQENIFYSPFSKDKIKSLYCKMELEAVLCACFLF